MGTEGLNLTPSVPIYPHESLNDMTPVEYRQIHQPETSSIAWT
jgi:hypothetical protein